MVKWCKHWSGSGSHLGWMETEKSITSPFYIYRCSVSKTHSPIQKRILTHYFSTHRRSGIKSIKCLVCLNLNKVTHLYGRILHLRLGRKKKRAWHTMGLATIADLFEEGVFYSCYAVVLVLFFCSLCKWKVGEKNVILFWKYQTSTEDL